MTLESDHAAHHTMTEKHMNQNGECTRYLSPGKHSNREHEAIDCRQILIQSLSVLCMRASTGSTLFFADLVEEDNHQGHSGKKHQRPAGQTLKHTSSMVIP